DGIRDDLVTGVQTCALPIFSVIELLCGFAPNYTIFLVLRMLYGIGMGGEWGVGASLAMESAPKRLRGVLSGILQSGYSMGYLLAAVAGRELCCPISAGEPCSGLAAFPPYLPCIYDSM